MVKEVIQSKQNAQIKQWRKLLTSKERKKQQRYLFEGSHLAIEALKWQVPIEQWIVTQSYYEQMLEQLGRHLPEQILTVIADNLATELSPTPAPQGVFAVVKMPEQTAPFDFQGSRYLLLDRIQDPGNMGTLIRTADAAKFDGVIIGEGSVDIYNDKVIRSSQGSIWHLPIITTSLTQSIEVLKENNCLVVATALDEQAVSFKQINSNQKLALIVGNEGQGISDQLLKDSDQVIYIPMPGNAESLNVSIAASILMFHYIPEELCN